MLKEWSARHEGFSSCFTKQMSKNFKSHCLFRRVSSPEFLFLNTTKQTLTRQIWLTPPLQAQLQSQEQNYFKPSSRQMTTLTIHTQVIQFNF